MSSLIHAPHAPITVVARACTFRLIVVIAFSLAGCGGSPPSGTDSGSSAAEGPTPSGRSLCLDSVREAQTNLQGQAADALEELQASNEGEPGFLAVVFDGQDLVIVVERALLNDWELRERPPGIRVAPSCVDPALLASVRHVVSGMEGVDGAILSAGYDALDDSIFVRGVSSADLLLALDELNTQAGRTARVAIADGTLRISP